MKELDFNTENSVKVVKGMGCVLVTEYARDVLCSKIIGKQPDTQLKGMAMAASLLVDILTKETEFRNAFKLLSEKGVTVE